MSDERCVDVWKTCGCVWSEPWFWKCWSGRGSWHRFVCITSVGDLLDPLPPHPVGYLCQEEPEWQCKYYCWEWKHPGLRGFGKEINLVNGSQVTSNQKESAIPGLPWGPPMRLLHRKTLALVWPEWLEDPRKQWTGSINMSQGEQKKDQFTQQNKTQPKKGRRSGSSW